MIEVVPPHAAARVPVSKVSEAAVPPNGSSMWVCTSMPPGMTYFPPASMVASALTPAAVPGAYSAAMVSPSTRTSIGTGPVAFTTVPPVISVRLMALPPVALPPVRLGGSWRHQIAVRVRPAVPVELPAGTDLQQQVHVQVADDDLGPGVGGEVADRPALGVGEVRRAVEVVVAEVLDADPVDGADVVLVGDRGGGLLQLPQVVGQAAAGRRGVEDDLGTVEPERAPPLREVPVVADVDADPADRGVEHRIAQVAGPEVELLPEPPHVRQVGLAVLAEIAAVRVQHGRGVVKHAGLLLLVHRQDHDQPEVPGERLEPLDRGAGHRLGVVVELRVLDLAEVRPVEQLLEADDLGALRGGFPRVLLVRLGHALLVTGPGGLNERCAHRRGHDHSLPGPPRPGEPTPRTVGPRSGGGQ